jgi:dihydrodipicolinate synthase/N-acetylneuraminate lyase
VPEGDLDGARRINDRLDPLVRVFYAPPFVDMHNRMKEALVMLGRIPAAHVRPPLTPIPDASASDPAALDGVRLDFSTISARPPDLFRSRSLTP